MEIISKKKENIYKEKSNHTIDDEDKKTDPVGLAVSAFFAVRKYLVFADVKSEGTRYKKHRCQAPMLLSAILNHH